MKSATNKNSTATAPKKPVTSTWKFGNIFAKSNNSTLKKEDTIKNSTTGTKETLHWTEKVKGLNANDRMKVMETELRTLEDELRDKRETIKCLRELGSGFSLISSAADFHKIKDKECRQLIEDTQALYRELDDFNQTVISDVNSRCDSPVPPVAELMPLSNGDSNGGPFSSRHYQGNKSDALIGPAFVTKNNSKLANIRWNWGEHNLRIVELTNRLRIAYNYIKGLEGGDSIAVKNIPTTERTPGQKERHAPALWHVPEGKGVDEGHKSMLLAMAGSAISDSDEDIYKATPAKSFYEPPSQIDKAPVSTMMIGNNYSSTYDNGQQPDWLGNDGEIQIKPVQAVFINSLHGKLEKINESYKNNSYENSIGEPKIVPSTAKSKNQSTSQFVSQNAPTTRPQVNESDVSDTEEFGKISSPGHKAYNWSNYTAQSSYATSSTNNRQAQNTSGMTNPFSYHNEQGTLSYSNDSDVD
ncbi:unnamed protein product [Rodentolepis nana]|uniref:Caprin-1_dimer domain-containing protein n=1 Tax=Rodentolepis nana TaxID=102285 RepID=A0A0R3T2X2_RODNA|nr:unnamed protein product [Rodentolepis nana]